MQPGRQSRGARCCVCPICISHASPLTRQPLGRLVTAEESRRCLDSVRGHALPRGGGGFTMHTFQYQLLFAFWFRVVGRKILSKWPGALPRSCIIVVIITHGQSWVGVRYTHRGLGWPRGPPAAICLLIASSVMLPLATENRGEMPRWQGSSRSSAAAAPASHPAHRRNRQAIVQDHALLFSSFVSKPD
jgi:hypothetical protein